MERFEFQTSEVLRVDVFLQKELPAKIGGECSNSKIRRLIVAGAVAVNGRTVTRPAFELRGKSKVVVEFDKDKFFFEKQPDDIKFECSDKDVLFEDENLIFINKPSMFPVEQTITGNRANLHDAVVDYLWKRNPSLRNPPYVGIMHRLDRETSGVILFTKNRSINKAVSDMFQGHSFEKKYVAIVGKSSVRGEFGVLSSEFLERESSVISRQSSVIRSCKGEMVVGEKFGVLSSEFLERETSVVSHQSSENGRGKSFVKGSGRFAEGKAAVDFKGKSFVKQGKHFVGEKFSVEMFMGRVSGKSQAGKWGQTLESKGGQYSKTDFEIIGEGKFEGKDCYIVECNLFTGRTHQIRVHLSSVGLPLLGDELYGGLSAKRIYLHASQLKCNSESLSFDVSAPVVW